MTTQLHTEPFTVRYILIQQHRPLSCLFSHNPTLLKALPPVAVCPPINVLPRTPERSCHPQLSTRPVRVSGTPKDLVSILGLCVWDL